ncbi:MAG: sigma-70 family RNA polymerase sigma factor, partial [Bacteroidales bacterium]
FMAERSNTFPEIHPAVWKRLQQGDRHALEVIFACFYHDLFFYGIKLCRDELRVSDAIQDVFLTLWSTRERLHTIRHPKAYLFRMFRHRILYLCKQSALRERHNERYATEKRGFVFSAEELTIAQEQQGEQHDNILSLLNTLTERQREIIYLKFYGNYNPSEIAVIMNMKKQSVANLLTRTLHTLREKAFRPPSTPF